MELNDHDQNQINKFIENISLFENCIRSMVIRLMLIKINDKWQIRYGIIVIYPEKIKTNKEEVILDSEIIKIIDIRIKPIDIKKLCKQVINGDLSVNGKKYNLGKENIELSIYYWTYEGDKSFEKFGIATKFHTLRIERRDKQRNIPNEYYDKIDNLLRSNIIPFDGASDLSQRFFLYDEPRNLLYDPWNFIIYSPSLIGFELDSTFQENGFFLRLWSDKNVELKDIRITFLDQTPGYEFKNRSIKINKKDIKKESGNLIFIEKMVKNPKYQIISAKIFLSYKKQFIALNEFYNPHFKTYNKGISILKKIDPTLELFFESMKGDKKEKDFEIAITNLFGICGFIALPFDRISGFQDWADLVIIDPYSSRGLIVETTLLNITKNNKLEKLKIRFDDLKTILPDTYLIPLIITSNDSVNENELKLAAEKGVAVFTIDDLKNLFEYAKQLVGTDYIFEYIKKKIPILRKDDQKTFPWQ